MKSNEDYNPLTIKSELTHSDYRVKKICITRERNNKKLKVQFPIYEDQEGREISSKNIPWIPPRTN